MPSEDSSTGRPDGHEARGPAPSRSMSSGPGRPDPHAVPEKPTQVAPRSWSQVARRTFTEFRNDNLTDRAAALTYYAVLSLFPGLIVLVSVLGRLGRSTTAQLQGTLTAVGPSQVRDILNGAINQVHSSGSTAGIAAILGLVGAFWSSSGYVAAFMRASNAIYDVPEGRPVWKTLPIRLGITAVVGVMLVASLLIVVVTGRLARQAGDLLGLGSAAVTAWDIAKWPVLLVLVSLIFAILYWASPNARHGGFRWVSPGGIVAVVAWLIASALFALYVSNFGSYNKTYGSLAAVIVFLVWLWVTNTAILFGAELDAELERQRAIAAGHPPGEEPFVELRDDRKLKRGQAQRPGKGR
ncbi:YihY/virulence factor BrkB family protein [Micromonospora sp. SL4-19]|uniref:YihY/virulence factor BrkB family protein n=1 Tax=Micromonospora sp. SL4-19 TaxID=3399129 RepID=UPI003A4E38E1